jgi:hypothetical protein
MNVPALMAVAFNNMSAQWSRSGCLAAEKAADVAAVLPPERVRQAADCLIRGLHGEAGGTASGVQIVGDVEEPSSLVVGRLSERLCDAQKVGRLHEAPTEGKVSRHLEFSGQMCGDALGRARAGAWTRRTASPTTRIHGRTLPRRGGDPRFQSRTQIAVRALARSDTERHHFFGRRSENPARLRNRLEHHSST